MLWLFRLQAHIFCALTFISNSTKDIRSPGLFVCKPVSSTSLIHILYHTLQTPACFLHQARVCMPHLSGSHGLVDLKCFQMCKGSDLLAPSAAPRAWGPRSLPQPCRRPLRRAASAADDIQAPHPLQHHIWSLLQRRQSKRTGGAGGGGGGFSVLVCLRSVYELRGLCEHMYAKLFTYASVKKKKTFLFNLVFFLFVILTFVSS